MAAGRSRACLPVEATACRRAAAMNMQSNPSKDQLRELLKRCDDAAGHHLLWVSNNGDVELSRLREGQTAAGFEQAHPEMRVRFEAFQAGNEYVGPDAAADDEWVSELFNSLATRWA